VYFISQSPSDLPESILGQCGNRVQHALRAFTPKDQAAVKAAAKTFRPNPAFETEREILELGTGEALVSFLDEEGAPAMVQRAKILFPLSQIGAITDEQRAQIIQNSRICGKYEDVKERESAFEIIAKQREEAEKQAAEAKEKARKEREEARKKAQVETCKSGKNTGVKSAVSSKTSVKGTVEKFKMNTEDHQLSGNFEKNRGVLPMPITGPYVIVGRFGQYAVTKNVRLDNKGIDIRGKAGAKARAIFDGEVSAIFKYNGLSNVLIRHGNYISVYCNLSSVSVAKGSKVKTRGEIGTIHQDASGNVVLHFQLRKETTKLNPEVWLGR
jgi:septal ring factor EnvC (AmiA/AmiB activator)